MVGFQGLPLGRLAPLGPLLLVILLVLALSPYSLSTTSVWHPFWDQDDVQDMIDDVPVAPNIWTDGCREPIPHLDVEIVGAGAFVHSPAILFDNNHWGHAQDLDDCH